MGIDPRIADLRSGSQTGTTTPDLDRAEPEENLEAEAEEGEEAEGNMVVVVKSFHLLFQRETFLIKVRKQVQKQMPKGKKIIKI